MTLKARNIMAAIETGIKPSRLTRAPRIAKQGLAKGSQLCIEALRHQETVPRPLIVSMFQGLERDIFTHRK